MDAPDLDLLKLAYLPDRRSAIDDLLHVLCDHRKANPKPITVLSMGIRGKMTRFVFPFHGSAMTYARVTGADESEYLLPATIKEISDFFGHVKVQDPQNANDFYKLVCGYFGMN